MTQDKNNALMVLTEIVNARGIKARKNQAAEEPTAIHKVRDNLSKTKAQMDNLK